MMFCQGKENVSSVDLVHTIKQNKLDLANEWLIYNFKCGHLNLNFCRDSFRISVKGLLQCCSTLLHSLFDISLHQVHFTVNYASRPLMCHTLFAGHN